MTDIQDYNFLTMPVKHFAQNDVIESQFSREMIASNRTRIKHTILNAQDFFGKERRLLYMGQLLAFKRSENYDKKILSGDALHPLFNSTTSAYLSEVFDNHGWEAGALIDRRQELITNPEDALKTLNEIAGVVEFQWESRLRISREAFMALGLSEEELQTRLGTITDEQVIELITGATPQEPL